MAEQVLGSIPILYSFCSFVLSLNILSYGMCSVSLSLYIYIYIVNV